MTILTLSQVLDKEKRKATSKGKLLSWGLLNLEHYAPPFHQILTEGTEVEVLKMKLQARDQEMLSTKSAIDGAHQDARKASEALGMRNKKTLPQEALDSSLAVARKRNIEIQKAHNHLLARYNQLQEAYMDLKESYDQSRQDLVQESPPLLSRGAPRSPLDAMDGHRSSSPTPGSSYKSVVNTGPGHPGRINTSNFAHNRHESKDGGMVNAAQGAVAYHFGPHGPNSRGSIGSDEYSFDGINPSGKSKIKPQSEMRVYGRGGVQNIGKKEKDGKDKGKGKGKDKEPTSPAVDGTQSVGKKKKGLLGGFGGGHTPGYT